MAYLPMKGRRATVAFFAVVAAGATIIGISLDRDRTAKDVALHAVVPAEPEAADETGAIPVVNADGSLRRPDDTSAMSEDPSGLEDEGFAMEMGEGMDDAPADGSETDWSEPDRPLQHGVAGRIE